MDIKTSSKLIFKNLFFLRNMALIINTSFKKLIMFYNYKLNSFFSTFSKITCPKKM